MGLLQVQRVFAGYAPGTPVIRDISLELEAGDFVGLLGPNGCGKSTLIRAVTGIVPTLAGTVLIAGRNLRSLPRRELARLLAVVPQDTGTPFSFSVRETVFMGRHPYLGRFRRPDSGDWQAVEEALRLTDTQELAERSLDEISGGERQRVIIARALAQQPRVLLLDEPTSHLDINHQVEVFDLLYELNRSRGLAILCVTHDLNFASAYCSRLMLMHGGRVVSVGPPAQVLTAERIRAVFGVDVAVEAGPLGAGPRIMPLRCLARSATSSCSQEGRP